MRDGNHDENKRFYKRVVARIDSQFTVPDDLCFILVQHAFTPSLDFFSSINHRIAAVIPKGSSARSNPDVVAQLKRLLPGRVYDNITRDALRDTVAARHLLKHATQGRTFAILEYGAYFAPSAVTIGRDDTLADKFVGIVEGTENGIKGSDDGETPGYRAAIEQLNRPVVSKSRSAIKHIMDLQIGPAIVSNTERLLMASIGCRLTQWRDSIGVIGLGSIGRGVLQALRALGIKPGVFDTDIALMTELAYRKENIAQQDTLLASSDILFLNTGSCFLSRQPELLRQIKDYALLVLCTSGDVEAGIPQLIKSQQLHFVAAESTREIGVYTTRYGNRIRVLMGSDGIGQAPNMTAADGSGSAANLMSDMEFYALGVYLASQQGSLPGGTVYESPRDVQDIIMSEWLTQFYPHQRQSELPERRVTAAKRKSDSEPSQVS